MGTQAPDNFAKIVVAIPALVEHGVKIRIATTVESIEDAELDRLCALHRRLGVPDSDHIHPADHLPRPSDRRGARGAGAAG